MMERALEKAAPLEARSARPCLPPPPLAPRAFCWLLGHDVGLLLQERQCKCNDPRINRPPNPKEKGVCGVCCVELGARVLPVAFESAPKRSQALATRPGPEPLSARDPKAIALRALPGPQSERSGKAPGRSRHSLVAVAARACGLRLAVRRAREEVHVPMKAGGYFGGSHEKGEGFCELAGC